MVRNFAEPFGFPKALKPGYTASICVLKLEQSFLFVHNSAPGERATVKRKMSMLAAQRKQRNLNQGIQSNKET